jgi:Bacterial toxin 30
MTNNIKMSLINTWLKNGTNLDAAIAILNQGVDLNLIGTSSRGGDFTNMVGASINEIVSRIPEKAKIENWTSIPGGAQEGMKFSWKDTAGNTWRVRMQGPDPNAPAGSHAASGWVLRVKRGHDYMDATGSFYKESIENPRSPNYNPEAINQTHISIQHP